MNLTARQHLNSRALFVPQTCSSFVRRKESPAVTPHGYEDFLATDETQIKKVAILLRKMKAERAMDVESISRLLVRIASLAPA